MKELERKRKIRRTIYSAPLLVVFAILAIFLVKGTAGVVAKQWESTRRVKELEVRAATLKDRRVALEREMARLQTEEGTRREIKERFTVTEEGEYVAVIVDEQRPASSTEQTRRSWYQRLWAVIIGSK